MRWAGRWCGDLAIMHVFSSRDMKGTIGMLRGRVSWTVTIGVGVLNKWMRPSYEAVRRSLR